MILYHPQFPVIFIVWMIQIKKYLVISVFQPVHPDGFLLKIDLQVYSHRILIRYVLPILFTAMVQLLI